MAKVEAEIERKSWIKQVDFHSIRKVKAL